MAQPSIDGTAAAPAGRACVASSWGARPRAGETRLELVPRARVLRPPFLQARSGGGAIFSSHFEWSSFTGAGGDLPPYLEGYSTDHIATIMGFPKCPSHNSLENLEEISDSEMNSSMGSRPSDQVEEVTSGSEGGGACEEQCECEDEVEVRTRKPRVRGKRLRVRVRRPKSLKCWSDQVWS
ncbi:UNVERIFIED_CONTAM: hypothetical protein Slati_1706200 [Sesamum latifolium]|uniref:Uncharacterized protein n=1 Tax=Sesamum latifolium TaxID=2727402 RepID=A0AAW2WW96_9LAMI